MKVGRSGCPRGGYCDVFRQEHEALVEKGDLLTAEQQFNGMTYKKKEKERELREMR